MVTIIQGSLLTTTKKNSLFTEQALSTLEIAIACEIGLLLLFLDFHVLKGGKASYWQQRPVQTSARNHPGVRYAIHFEHWIVKAILFIVPTLQTVTWINIGKDIIIFQFLGLNMKVNTDWILAGKSLHSRPSGH